MTKKRITTRATALFSAVTFESPHKELTARRLSPADVTQAVALTAEAGWNQIDADWAMMLALGDGIGIFDASKLVATAIIQPYDSPVGGNPKFAWISMVLVTPFWQRKGLARWLLERCIATLQGAGYMPMLDATPAGREVYRKLGFVEGLEIERLERKGLPTLGFTPVGCAPLSADRVADAAKFDQACFAADRTDLIASLQARALPAYIAERNGKVDGIAMMRAGQRAFHLGPVEAADVSLAGGLLQSFGVYIGERPVFIDAFAHQTVFVDALKKAGFVLQRKLTRMHLGAKAPGVLKDRYFAIAGPELG